jgi:CHASE2 domain-containing sensor protein
MKKRRHKKAASPAAANRASSSPSVTVPAASASAAGSEPVRTHSFLHHLIVEGLIGIAITLLLVVLNWGIEKTAFGEEMRDTIYDLLQLRLASQFNPNDLNVAVVDLSGIPMAGPASEPDLQYTDRLKLKEVIENIANQHPKAIAIDLDFTPYPAQVKDDAAFLKFCLALENPKSNLGYLATPVHVGGYTSLELGPSLALLDPNFAPLVAFAGVPTAEGGGSPKKMVETIDIYYQDEASGAQKTWTVPSLSAAAAGIELTELPKWRGWAFDRVPVAPKKSFRAREFYVDYAPLDTLENQTVLWNDPSLNSTEPAFAGKIVFVGRGKNSANNADQHIIPGHRDATHAGVYMHACAAYTLMRGVLTKLSANGRLALDILTSLFVLIIVGAVRYHYRGSERFGGIAHHRLEGVVTALVLTIALGASFYAVNVHRIMWDDSVFVAAGMLIHRKLEKATVGITRLIVRLLTVGWGLLLFKQDEDAYRPLDEHHHGH